MMALSMFLVLLAIFLLASLGDAFVNQARLNHLIRFDASKSNPTIKSSRVPFLEPTSNQMNDQTTHKRLEWYAEFSNVLSSKKSCGLCHGKKSEPGLLKQPVQYDKEIIRSSPAVDAFSQQALHSFQYASINHKRRFSASVRVPFSTICPFGGLSCWVQSLAAKVQASSTPEVSCHAIALSAFEPVTSTNQNSFATIALKAIAEMQASAVKNKSNDALPFGGKSNEPFTYASLFGDKPSSTHWLVVAFVRNQDFIGQTIDSSAGYIASAQIQTLPKEVQVSADKTKPNKVSSFDDKPSSTFQLVVASVDWISQRIL